MFRKLFPRPASRKPSAARPGVEALECRAVPALLTTLTLSGISGDLAGGAIGVTSFSFAESNDTGNKPALEGFHVTLKESRATPAILLAAARGAHIKTAVISEQSAAGSQKPVEVLRYTLSDVLISSFRVQLGKGEIVPTDEIDLRFAAIEDRYTPQLPGGKTAPSVKASWDGRKGIVDGTLPAPAKVNAPVGLKIDGIPGEFLNGSAIDSYRFSESNAGGKTTLNDFHFTFKTGDASPYLLVANDTGQVFKSATLTAYRTTKAGQSESERITLGDVRVTSYATADGEDEVTLRFDRVEQRVTPLTADGKAGAAIIGQWDGRRGSVSGSQPLTIKGTAPLGLKIDGVPGDYLNGSAATSYSWAGGVSTGSGSTALADFEVVLPVGVASPYLLVANDTGQTFKSVKLTAYQTTKNGQVLTETWELSGARVTSYTTADGQDTVTFHFDSLKLT
jgi:type VI protein secretion system component Hcp